MTISEKQMNIVIDNYFKTECDVNTSIRKAFEKGFRIGVQKGTALKPEQQIGQWITETMRFDEKYHTNVIHCSKCGVLKKIGWRTEDMHYCPNCGVKMEGKE